MSLREEFVEKIKNTMASSDIESVQKLDLEFDLFFDLDVQDTEKEISLNDESLYVGLDPRALLTSYIDYYQILEDVPKGEELVDVGAGYCRGTILSEFLGLNKCHSIEIVKERITEAFDAISNFSGDTSLLLNQDLSTCTLPEAYGYFLYFPKGEILYRILSQLFELSKHQDCFLYVCESHGDMLDYLNMFSSITQVKSFKVSQPRHSDQIVKYEIRPLNGVLNWKSDLAEWMLVNRNSDEFFVIKKMHNYFQDYVDWLVKIKDQELILYNGKRSLYELDGRIISIDEDEPIKNITSLPQEILNLFSDRDYKKIIKYKECFYLEHVSGELEKLSR